MTDNKRKPRAFSLKTPTSEKTSKSDGKTASYKSSTRKPRAIKTKSKTAFEIKMLPESAVDQQIDAVEDLTPPPPLERKKRFGWFKLAFASFSALIALGIGLYVDSMVRELFARHEWLGIAAAVFTAIFVIAILAMIVSEIWGITRMRSIDKLRTRGTNAKNDNDLKLAKNVAADVCALLEVRPETAQGRTLVQAHIDTVMDGADLIHLVERDLLAPLDKSARALVMASAKRISIVTAVSPRAIVDIGFVLYENIRLIRIICEHYGGRPTTLGFWRLAKRVVTHLAATGAIAVGDGVLQQVIGHGVASKLSARLGEGVVNGLLCARIGIAAIDVCRPLPFDAEKRPGVSDFLSALTKFNPDKA